MIWYRILCNLGVPIFDPKWTRFAPKSPRTFPTLFQYICVINYITALEAHWKAVVGAGNALKGPKTAINGKSCNRIISEGVDGANVLKCDFFWCRPYLINKTRRSKNFEVNWTTPVVWVGFTFKFWHWIFTFKSTRASFISTKDGTKSIFLQQNDLVSWRKCWHHTSFVIPSYSGF